jgi:hypothetical protein
MFIINDLIVVIKKISFKNLEHEKTFLPLYQN